MKKKHFLLAYFLVFSCTLEALPLGNPLEPALLGNGICTPWCYPSSRFSIGFYGDYVFNRHLRVHGVGPERQVHKTRIITNAVFFPRWDPHRLEFKRLIPFSLHPCPTTWSILRQIHLFRGA
jgi:hypothetical protein